METIMNDKDSKAFLKDMARLYPQHKENFRAVSNLIVLLMEELQKEREGRKRGEKYKKIYNEIYERSYRGCQIDMEIVKQKYFPEQTENKN